MFIQSAAQLRRLVFSGSVALLSMFGLCAPAAQSQQTVSAGSVVPFNHSNITMGQVYRILQATDGTIVFDDVSLSAVYELPAGSDTLESIASGGTPIDGTYLNEGMALDPQNTLYIGMRYNSPAFFRVPYVNGTWSIQSSSAFATNVGSPPLPSNVPASAKVTSSTGPLNVVQVAWTAPNNLIVGRETEGDIWNFPIISDGNGGYTLDQANGFWVVGGLEAKPEIMSVDKAGNIFFIENFGSPRDTVAVGLWEIPVGTKNLFGDQSGTLEATQLTRIDPPSEGNNFRGISFDAAGNMYVTEENDAGSSYGGIANMVYLIPNEGTLTAPKYVYADGTDIAPVQGSGNLLVDSRGFLWVPNAGNSFQPTGDNVIPGTQGVVKYALGNATLPETAVGTTGTAGTVYYTFTTATTPGTAVLSQQGGASSLVLSPTDPNAKPVVAPALPPKPCTAGTAYSATGYCAVWVAAKPTIPGPLSGQLVLQDPTGKPYVGGTAYLGSIGDGPAISGFGLTSSASLATTLSTPRQVATDALGNVYVADAGQGKVLMYAGGTTTAAAGTPVGTGLQAPTGVAVDGSGDVYIADSGNVYELPYQGGKLGAQTTIQTGLGKDVNLAVDTLGDVFVADQDNARVVKIPNPQQQGNPSTIPATLTVGSGFTAPSAVAVDAVGDVYVADSGSLYQLTALGAQATVTSALSGTVNGLAVDASNSVLVAGATGLERIPYLNGSLSINSVAGLSGGGTGSFTGASGVAVDPFGNAYLTYSASNGPVLAELSTNGAISPGRVPLGIQVGPYSGTIFNTGNLPLNFTGAPVITSAYPKDFALETAPNFPCDTTGMTAVAQGGFCDLAVDIDASVNAPPSETATISEPTNALNVAAPTIQVTAIGDSQLFVSSTTVATTSPNGYTYPGQVTVTATVASGEPAKSNGAVPTGTATVSINGFQDQNVPAATLVGGVATFNLTGLSGGTYTLTVNYSGDSTFLASNGSTSITVSLATPTVTVGTVPTYVQQGVATLITATIAGPAGTTPTGTVNFLQGSTPVDPTQVNLVVDASGNVTFNTNKLAAGSYSLTAVYSGDANFNTASSAPINFQVLQNRGNLLLTANPTSLTLTPGVPGSAQITVTALATYSDPAVTFYCDPATLPQYSECTFDFPTVQITGTPFPPLNVTISTNVPVQSGTEAQLRDDLGKSPVVFAGLFGAGILGLCFARGSRRQLPKLLSLLLLVAAVSLGAGGCGGGYSNPPAAPKVVTPAGTFNVSIVAIGTHNNDIPSGLGPESALPFTLPVTVK